MTLKMFRKSMGLLGLQSTSILADRIFKCMDKNNNSKVSFEEFLEYMDIVMHGTKEEKCMQSYRLISQHEQHITYQEFSSWLKSVWRMYNELTGSQIQSGEENIRALFIAIDFKKDGVIDFEEYSKGVNSQASMMQWFNFVSMGVLTPAEDAAEPESSYRDRIESIENNLHLCIEMLRENNRETGEMRVGDEEEVHDWGDNREAQEFPIVDFGSANEYSLERGPKCISRMEFEHAGDVDSPVFHEESIYETQISSMGSSMVLEKLQALSMKVNNLKTEEENFRRSTLFNVPKNNTERKKNKISWGDEDWSMILYMMLGIQKSVNAVPEVDDDVPTLEHYGEMAKFSLVPQKKQKLNQKTCSFTDFVPMIFGKLRRLFVVENTEYLKSLGVEKIMASLLRSEFSSLVGLISSGKSGSFFYFSDDGKYVLKTMSPEEFVFFKKILPDYFNYLYAEPGSLIPKIFGFHNIRYYSGGEKLKKSFIVMENLFSSGHEIHLRFDLKGSTVGRSTDPSEDFSVARKDLDFNRSRMKIRLSAIDKVKVLEQIRKDCDFFQRLEIIDYSLLLGIHHLKNSVPDISQLKNAYISADGQYLYFIGIIDILTRYGSMKKFENLVKSPFLGSDISCVPPKQYADRFYNYILSVVE